jgi:hypothetical protein
LLTANGKIVRKWDGYPTASPGEFINEVKAAADAAK